jgi:hypothetical protein
MFGTEIEKSFLNKNEQFVSLDAYRGQQSFSQKWLSITNKIDCTVQYFYGANPPFLGNNPYETVSEDNFTIALSCGGPAVNEHYPVTS